MERKKKEYKLNDSDINILHDPAVAITDRDLEMQSKVLSKARNVAWNNHPGVYTEEEIDAIVKHSETSANWISNENVMEEFERWGFTRK